MTTHLKQTGTEDSTLVLSIDDSARGLYDECKKISKLIADHYNCNNANKELIFGSEPWCNEVKRYADEFSKLFGSLIEPFILEQRLSILDIAHPLKEENPVSIVCRTLGIEGLKVRDTMDVLHEVGDREYAIESIPSQETELKVKDVVTMIYGGDPLLYPFVVENVPLQTLEELFYGYTPNLVCNLHENVIKIWGYLKITPHAMADRIGFIVVEDIAKLIEKGSEQFSCPLEYGGFIMAPVNKMKDTIDYFTRIYKNKNLIEWARLETLRSKIKDEKDETVRSFLFKNYKNEILRIAQEIK
ncbi:hypothetical protein HYU07_02115 [Candidatus Woesearchaeota archaeon]|nr:hypothetical protein [Candidatus Woesearchaeota archaeon]